MTLIKEGSLVSVPDPDSIREDIAIRGGLLFTEHLGYKALGEIRPQDGLMKAINAIVIASHFDDQGWEGAYYSYETDFQSELNFSDSQRFPQLVLALLKQGALIKAHIREGAGNPKKGISDEIKDKALTLLGRGRPKTLSLLPWHHISIYPESGNYGARWFLGGKHNVLSLQSAKALHTAGAEKLMLSPALFGEQTEFYADTVNRALRAMYQVANVVPNFHLSLEATAGPFLSLPGDLSLAAQAHDRFALIYNR